MTGVGSVNREQIEKVFYRGFTVLLPSNATFVAARGATTQAARDLYGSNSRVEQAVDQAWTAVGVPDPRSVSTVTLTVPRLSQTSVAFQMTSSGIYDVNLRGNDADIDLDMFLTPEPVPARNGRCRGAASSPRPSAPRPWNRYGAR